MDSVRQVMAHLKADPNLSPAYRRALPAIPKLTAIQLDPRDPAVLTDDPTQQELRITACEAVDRVVELPGNDQAAINLVGRYLFYAATLRGFTFPWRP